MNTDNITNTNIFSTNIIYNMYFNTLSNDYDDWYTTVMY